MKPTKKQYDAILRIKTKAQAIIEYRNLMGNQTLLFTNLAEAMNYARATSYTWDEELPLKIRNEITGFLIKLYNKKTK